MVVLNFYGKIEPICISQKLRLFVSNLPNEEHNEWKEELAEELDLAVKADRIYQQNLGTNYPCGISSLYQNVFPEKQIPKEFTKEHYDDLASRMIYIYQDYSYEDMPLGGRDTNCFDGRFCEEDYGEKIIDLITFLSDTESIGYEVPSSMPQWVFSTNHDGIDHHRIFWSGGAADNYLLSLKKWGKLFDAFLQSKNDYLLFDYLANVLHKDNEYNEAHLMKAYSLCQLFLEKHKEQELDEKLPLFLNPNETEDERKEQAKQFRKMRNKIAHGDFLAFEQVVDEYASNDMDGNFSFDYSELSRKNWAIQHVCCTLDDAIRRMILMSMYIKRIPQHDYALNTTTF